MLLKTRTAFAKADTMAASLPEAERESFKKGFIQGWLARGRNDSDNERRRKKNKV